jgi:hypothetical protein
MDKTQTNRNSKHFFIGILILRCDIAVTKNSNVGV